VIAALLIAACAVSPLFDMSGPPCGQPFTQCGCSECMVWSPDPGSERYEIMRHDPGGFARIVGTTRIYELSDDDGNVIGHDPQELWCFAWDSPFPAEGATYSYEVRGCSGMVCGPWTGTSASLTYVAAPYWCWTNGMRTPC
jgi:hypothetical protein